MPYLDLIKQIEIGISEDMAWLRAMQVFTKDRALDWLIKLLEVRHNLRGDAASFLYHGGLYLITQDIGAGLYRKILELMPRDSAFLGIIECLAGYEAAANLDLDTTVKRLRIGFYNAFNAAKTAFTADTKHTGDMIELAREANLLEPTSYTRAGFSAPTLPNIQWLGPNRGPPRRSPLILSVCDAQYFQTYSPRFLSSLKRACPEFDACIHVINPDAETISSLTTLTENRPELRISIEHGPHHKTYFASRRFLLAGEILDHFGCSIAIIDFDSVLHDEFHILLDRVMTVDIAYSRTASEVRPTSIIKAAFLFVGTSEIARRFLRHTTDYLIGKLGEDPLWMVDQVALFRSVCLMKGYPGIIDVSQHVAINPLTALGADHILSFDDRVAQRGSVSSTLQFSRDMKPIYSVSCNVWADAGLSPN